MNEKKNQGNFIPCGDAMEKMGEILDDELEGVSGGMEKTIPTVPMYSPDQIGTLFGKHTSRDGVCSVCGCNAYNKIENGVTYLVCSKCGHRE